MGKGIWAAVLLLGAVGAQAQDHAAHAAHAAAQAQSLQGESAAGTVADVPVQDQSGRSLHFHRDLVQGRLVAINFVFTRCTTVCPLLGARFAQVQKQLGDDAGRVALISVSIDPANDTPQELARWGRAFGAAPGWSLVTGARADIDQLARSLGASAADPASHVPLVLLIDERGKPRPWRRLDGLADATVLTAALRGAMAQPVE
ncbi:SCO family protein [Tahibacter sp.]|uniref:SCO family protein n=1 Tax=Tahibacter sp. TaxID=2056211 RepID=UPI0028C50001|nr:SCO family protein [Tahibacter sp.]